MELPIKHEKQRLRKELRDYQLVQANKMCKCRSPVSLGLLSLGLACRTRSQVRIAARSRREEKEKTLQSCPEESFFDQFGKSSR